MRNVAIAFIIIGIAVVLTNCSIQKRQYRRGYYIHWNHQNNKQDVSSSHSKISKSQITKLTTPDTLLNDNSSVKFESALGDEMNHSVIKRKRLLEKIDNGCNDSLWFTDGYVLNVEILDTTGDLVKYRRCDDYEGEFSVGKSRIDKIKYANGSVDCVSKQLDKAKRLHDAKKKIKIAIPMQVLSMGVLVFMIVMLATASGWFAVGAAAIMTVLISPLFLSFWMVAFFIEVNSLLSLKDIKENSKTKTIMWVLLGLSIIVFLLAIATIVIALSL